MGSERVKGCATKTNWKRRCSSQALPYLRVISVSSPFKVVARILRRILVTIYIYIDKNLNESTTVCSLRSLRSLALNYSFLLCCMDCHITLFRLLVTYKLHSQYLLWPFKCSHSLLQGELMDVAMTTTFRRWY